MFLSVRDYIFYNILLYLYNKNILWRVILKVKGNSEIRLLCKFIFKFILLYYK